MTNYKVFPHNNAYRIYYRAGDTAPWQDLIDIHGEKGIWRDYASFEEAELAMKRFLFTARIVAEAITQNRGASFMLVSDEFLKNWTPQ
jgi:hypothetical protein